MTKLSAFLLTLIAFTVNAEVLICTPESTYFCDINPEKRKQACKDISKRDGKITLIKFDTKSFLLVETQRSNNVSTKLATQMVMDDKPALYSDGSPIEDNHPEFNTFFGKASTFKLSRHNTFILARNTLYHTGGESLNIHVSIFGVCESG